MIWVRLRAPWAKGMVEFLCLLPLTIPALVIVVGLRNVYLWVTYFLGESALTLTFVYVVLVLPFAYRAIDAALSSIDLKTLAEAARSLGAAGRRRSCGSWCPTSGPESCRPPSSRSRWCSASTRSPRCPDTRRCRCRSSLIGKTDGPTSVAASLAVLLFGFVLLLVLSLVTRGRRRDPAVDARRPHALESRMTNGVAVELNDLTRVYGSVQGARRVHPAHRARRAGRAARPVGLRQDHGAADPRRPGRGHVGHACRSAARTSAACPPTSATWAWCSRPTACSRI